MIIPVRTSVDLRLLLLLAGAKEEKKKKDYRRNIINRIKYARSWKRINFVTVYLSQVFVRNRNGALGKTSKLISLIHVYLSQVLLRNR